MSLVDRIHLLIFSMPIVIHLSGPSLPVPVELVSGDVFIDAPECVDAPEC